MQRVQKTASVKHLNAESYHKKKFTKALIFLYMSAFFL